MKALTMAVTDITGQLRKLVSRRYARGEISQVQMNKALRLIQQLNDVLAPQAHETETDDEHVDEKETALAG